MKLVRTMERDLAALSAFEALGRPIDQPEADVIVVVAVDGGAIRTLLSISGARLPSG